jgi:HD-like signal output (HDOD) protein
MKRILFVDDEVPTLEGLRARLARMEHKWAMTFVESGAQALAEFQWHPYDVIVSDVGMPGMHGARLLRTVSERWPQAARIAMSGFTDQKQALRLVPIAHQFLRKPFEPMHLENVIARCLEMQDLLPRALRALLGRVQRVSPLRTSHAELKSLLARDTVTVHHVAQVIATDGVIAAKLLQTVNSAFFRDERRTSNIEQAVSHLGLTTVRNLVTSAEVFAQWPDKPNPARLDLERIQLHAQAMATVAHALTAGTPVIDDTCLAALLQDVGYSVLAQECPRELTEAMELARADRLPIHEAERQVIGASHAQVGAYMLGIWGLPHSVVEAVAHHHPYFGWDIWASYRMYSQPL